MFLLHWFVLQKDYIDFYTKPANPRLVTRAQALSKDNLDPHAGVAALNNFRELPEPAKRADHTVGSITYPGYVYFIAEVFPAFGLEIHYSKLPNGIQHRNMGRKTSGHGKVAEIVSVDLEAMIDQNVTDTLVGFDLDPNDAQLRKATRVYLLHLWEKEQAEEERQQAAAMQEDHRLQADKAKKTKSKKSKK